MAEMIATIEYLAERAKRGNVERALELLRRPRIGEPPREGDEIPESWKRRKAQSAAGQRKRKTTRSK